MPDLTPTQNKTVELAFGRILRMGSRPTQPGDHEEYERCRNLIMAVLRDGEDPAIEYRAGYPRERNKGAQGD